MDNNKKEKKSLKDYVKGKTLSGSVPNKIDLSPELSTKKIEEAKESTAVFAFGRFNPPTIGHEKLIHKVHQVAKEHNGQAHIVASHSQGTSKDPLPQTKKIEYLKKVAPEGVHVSGSSKENPNFLTIAKKMHEAGHKHLVMVAGADRADDFKKKLDTYNGKEGHYNFKSIKVVSAGERDPDAEGAEGMSGTKLRSHARAGQHKEFKAGLPKALHSQAKEIADTIRSVKEEVEVVDEAVLTIAQRRKRAINLKRREPRIQRQKILALKRFASEKALRRRSRNLARELARVRFAGKRGAAYKELSPSDKIAIDRQLQGKDKLIKALANRLYQRVRKREMARISRVRSGVKGSVGKQKTGMVAAGYEHPLNRELFETIFDKVITEKYKINSSQLQSLVTKANTVNMPLFDILEQYCQGRDGWEENNKNTPEQLGFNRVNSLVAKFKTELKENASSHVKQANDAQSKGEYAKAAIHRKIASALSRGDRSTAKGLMQQLSSVKEGLKDPKDNPCWKGYKPVGTKIKNGKEVPNCVPEETVKEAKLSGYSKINARFKSLSGRSLDAAAKEHRAAAEKAKQDLEKLKQGGIKALYKENLDENFCIDRPTGLGVMYTAADLGIKTKGGFAYHPSVIEDIEAIENFLDGKNPQDKGDMSRHGLKGKSIAQLKKIRSSDDASPRQKQLAHWFINMHKGKK